MSEDITALFYNILEQMKVKILNFKNIENKDKYKGKINAAEQKYSQLITITLNLQNVLSQSEINYSFQRAVFVQLLKIKIASSSVP